MRGLDVRPTASYVKPVVKKASEAKKGRLEEAQRTREALVAAAMELFAEEGLTKPSLDAICARAGFTRGAFYVHFATRDELIAAVVEKATGELIDAMIATGGGAPDLEGIVRTFAAAVRSGGFPSVGRVRGHQIMEACLRSPTLRAKYLELLVRARDRLSEVVRRGQSEATLRQDVEPSAIAQLLLALVLGVQTASELGAPYDADRVADDLLRMLAPAREKRPPSKGH